jgi:hypothetical protein
MSGRVTKGSHDHPFIQCLVSCVAGKAFLNKSVKNQDVENALLVLFRNCVEMDVEQLEAEAKATAAKHVINMLQRPGQLEKVSHHALQDSITSILIDLFT